MARRGLLLFGLVLALTCGPTAIPAAPSASPSAAAVPIVSSDLITLREGGQQPVFSVRKVASADLVTSLPAGLLLPDGKTVLTVERGAATTTVKKVKRQDGSIVATTQIAGGWELMHGWPWFIGASPDGSHVVLFGNSYNFTDQSGTWTAKTTFGVVDLASWHVEAIELVGRYDFEAVSNDGRLVYVAEYTQDNARTRVYDVSIRQLRDVTDGAMFSTPTYAGGFAFGMLNVREEVRPAPDVIQITTVNKLARLDLATGAVTSLTLPLGKGSSGEEALAWSLLPTRDGRSLFAVNPLSSIVSEFDLRAFQVRRTVQLTDTRSQRSLIDAVRDAIHPVALGKMEFLQGAAFSPDETKIYALALEGLWQIDVASLKATLLARSGAYQSLKVSPDGARLYVIGRENGVVTAIDSRTGAVLGTMKRIAEPSDILAVDAG